MCDFITINFCVFGQFFVTLQLDMKPSRITNYDPTLSVEENAANNNVTTAAMRAYIQARGIDRATDRQIYLYDKVKEYAREHPKEKAPQIADALGLSPNTVRRYLKMTEKPEPREKKSETISKADLKFISFSKSQTDILKTILAIHLPKKDRFQCDLTAWKLGFYKDGLLRPYHCYDKYASILRNEEVKDLAGFETACPDGMFESIVIDLPCSVEAPSTKSRFDVSTHFSSLPELFEEHEKMLRLAYRKMRTDGILVYKTMDFTYYGSPYWLSDEVLRMAKEIGFELADKFIYIDSQHCKIDHRRTRYTASVPAHAYFFVFRKRTFRK